MKKSLKQNKLNLEKLTVSKLTNPEVVKGGRIQLMCFDGDSSGTDTHPRM